MSEVRVNNLSNENNTGGPTISGITTFSGSNFLVPPVGDTASRPDNCPPGSLRFNTDSAHLEYYRGDTIGWVEIEAELTAPLGGTGGGGTGNRMIFMGGTDGSGVVDVIQFVTISTTANATDFGDLLAGEQEGASCSSHLRGFYFGGDPSDNDIEFVTFASLGNATDFGNCTAVSKSGSGCSDQTRGIMQLGASFSDTINYITMATTGDAVDFGNITAGAYAGAACDSSTRGVIALGRSPAGANDTKILEFVTIMSDGNSQDFGDLSIEIYSSAATSNGIRGVFSGNNTGSPHANADLIEFITIATKGNAQDFGNLSRATSASDDNNSMAATSNSIRGLFAGGYLNAPTIVNNIDFITIATTGNSSDFGDLLTARRTFDGCSDAHGGLGD